MPNALRAIEPDARVSTPAAVADELDRLMLRVAALGDALAEDTELVGRHLLGLQDIDRLAQMLEALGAVLRADDVESALATLPMRDLADRLAERLGI